MSLCPEESAGWEPHFKKYSERLSFLRDVGCVARIAGVSALGLVVNVLLVLGTRRAVCFLGEGVIAVGSRALCRAAGWEVRII